MKKKSFLTKFGFLDRFLHRQKPYSDVTRNEAENFAVKPQVEHHLEELVKKEVSLENGMEKSFETEEISKLKDKLYYNDLELKMYMIQKSTHTTFPLFLKLHEKLRMKYKWYYKWHLFPFVNKLHWGTLGTTIVLLTLAIISSALSVSISPRHVLANGPVPVTGVATVLNTNANLTFDSGTFLSNVTINNSTRLMAGYAWSDDMGWVDFGSGVDNPLGPVAADLSGHLSGKAKALSGGYIDFNADPTHANVVITGGNFSGYAWSDDVGWINFTGVAAAEYNSGPTGFSGAPVSPSQIDWSWTNSGSYDSLQVLDGSGNPISPVLAGNAVSWSEMALSANAAVTRKVRATVAGLSADSLTDIKYTFANKPDAPTITTTSEVSLTVIINANANPAGTEFAISCDGDTTFLNFTFNACEAIADDIDHWRTYTNWGDVGGFADTGLSINTQHTYKVIARNGDKVNTALSDPTAKYTKAAVPTALTVVTQSYDGVGNPEAVTIHSGGNPNGTNYFIQYKEIDASDPDPQTTCDNPAGFLQLGAGWAARNDGDIVTDYRTADKYMCYRIKAKNFDDIDDNIYSSTSVVTLSAPGQVSIVGILHNGIAGHTANTTSSITWGWNANATAPDGYKVYDYTGGVCTGTVKATALSPATSVVENAGLATDTSYARCDRAYRGALLGQPSNNFSAYTSIEPVAGITWGAIAADSIALTPINIPTNLNLGQSGIQYQNVTKGTGSSWQHDTTVYISGGLNADIQYAFTIQSRNGDADTTATTGGSKITLASDPGWMTATVLSSTDIKLDWLSGGAESKFNIYRDGESGVGALVHSANDLTYTDTGLAASSTHTYYLYAVNGDNLETTNFSTATATTQAVPASPPVVSPSPSPTTVETEIPHIPSVVVVNEPVTFDVTTGIFDLTEYFTMPKPQSDRIGFRWWHLIFPMVTTPQPAPHVDVSHIASIIRNSFAPKIANLVWDFGDGFSSAKNKVKHTYNQVGQYIVKLKVTRNGRDQEIVKKVTVIPPPPEITNIKAQGADISIEGKAYPESQVHLTISSSPITVSTQADKLGIFKYLFKQPEQKLEPGGHEIAAVSVAKAADGKEIAGLTSKTYNFFVDYQGQMAIVKKQAETWKWVALSLGLILIIIVLYGLFWRRIFKLKHS